ncbi:hypothetical protein [Streptomyces cyaneofuscatus]|uniref:hypothetical protein n=1 Tax=Streptomyces cyaneofuscatus TaxID=66883 RepID=UPI003870DFB4|nr:hypothetical protein OG973_32670 [Streptomyces cyaneofuscatus]
MLGPEPHAVRADRAADAGQRVRQLRDGEDADDLVVREAPPRQHHSRRDRDHRDRDDDGPHGSPAAGEEMSGERQRHAQHGERPRPQPARHPGRR